MGLAVWEPKTRWITPLPARIRKTLKDDLKFFAALVKERAIEAFLVGLPIGLDGRITESTENALFWVNKLKTELALPVHTYDESLSTKDALELLKDRSSKQKKEKKDSVAAALILEEFMRDRGLLASTQNGIL
ncbi:MAG: Holliday junction resolvase-like protein [Bacteriovoracaceae bacterium]|nr:Holliday junction resolvase-like protein [Bacteriovoracaceae bacterium]